MGDGARAEVRERVGLIVTTNEGPGPRLQRCLTSISDSDLELRVVVVDNSGSILSLEAQDCGNIEHVRVENRGFGAAANVGLARSSLAVCDVVGLLNDDVVVGPDWLQPLLRCLDADDSVGAVQPMLVLTDTEPPLINSLGVELDEFGAGSDIGYRTPESALIDDADRPIEIVTGGAVVFRRSFIDDVGTFDERLFLYYEDVDLCLRGAEKGWAFRCVPTSRVEHDKGATTDGLGDERRRLQERNRLVVAARFAPPAMLVRALWLSAKRLRHEPRAVHRRALAHGLARFPRATLERLASKRGRR